MIYIGESGKPANEIWIDDDGILYLKIRGVLDPTEDAKVHEILPKAAKIIRHEGKTIRLLIDMTEAKKITVACRRSSYANLTRFGAEYVAFAGSDRTTKILIDMTGRTMNGVYRTFDTVDQARAWLNDCQKDIRNQ